MKCIDIIIKYLKDNGYDGLFNDDDCACEIDGDLVPCGNDFSECAPGYKIKCKNGCTKYGFCISPDKEAGCPNESEV